MHVYIDIVQRVECKAYCYYVRCTSKHFLFFYVPEVKLLEMTIDYTQEMGTLLLALDPITGWR